ncbi:hypothetical protein ACWZEH_24675 [Streptomyces sp. QTS137]
MYEYEIAKYRSADLIRRADDERRAPSTRAIAAAHAATGSPEPYEPRRGE